MIDPARLSRPSASRSPASGRPSCVKPINLHADPVMVLRELLGRSGWLSLIQIADHALPLVTFPFVTRALGIEYFGDYAIVVGICSYFALFTIASAYVTGP